MVRIKDIASALEISSATVSRALSDDPRISPPTKEKVRALVKKTGYRMNDIARSLKTNRTRTIGLVVPQLAEEFFMKVAHGIEDELRNSGYQMLICNAQESVERERECLELLLQKRVDGIIVIPSTGSGTHLKTVKARGVPCVLVDRLVKGFAADAVVVDNFEATRGALSCLSDQSIARLGFIGGEMTFSTAQERYRGYEQALRERGIPLEKEIIKFGDFHADSGYALMKELCELDRPVRSLFIANHYMYVGAARYLVESGLIYEEAFDIVNFDEMSSSAALRLARITVSQPVVEIGVEAARLILDRASGRRSGRHRIVTLNTTLVFHDRKPAGKEKSGWAK